MKFTEAQLEAAIIELLEAEGYPYVPGEEIDRRPQEVLIKDDLRDYLAYRYVSEGITPGDIEAIIGLLERYSTADLYESNRAIMKLVADGFVLKREGRGPDGRERNDIYIQLIDYDDLIAFRQPQPGEVPVFLAEEVADYRADGNFFRIVNQLDHRRLTRTASRTAFSTSTACRWSSSSSRAPSAKRRPSTTPMCN